METLAFAGFACVVVAVGAWLLREDVRAFGLWATWLYIRMLVDLPGGFR